MLLVGAMLACTTPTLAMLWFIPLLLLLLRGVAVALGTLGEPLPAHQRSMICWFGIRGIGSIFYLVFALRQGGAGALAEQLISLTLMTVAVSILLHGISMRPLMRWYQRREAGQQR